MLIQKEQGITLVEMLVSIAIVGLLAGVFYQILSVFSSNFAVQDAITEMQQQGRFAADLVSREIDQTGYDPSGVFFTGGTVGAPFTFGNNCEDPIPIEADIEPILEASATVFHYLSDLDGDGVPGGPNEHVRYEWVDSGGVGLCGNFDANTLYRQSNGVQMQQVASNIVAFEFLYYDDVDNLIPNVIDGDGNPVTKTAIQRSAIWKVVLTLTAQTDRPDSDYPDNGGYRTREFEYDIWLKNV